MKNDFYDVIIVGGGPSGATAGLHLAEHGIKTLVLEKTEIPRDKPCGGGLTSRTLERFPRLQQRIEACTLHKVSTIHFYAPDLSSVRYTYDEPITYMIKRSEFDTGLIDQCRRAGATVITSARVVNLTIRPDYVEVATIHGNRFRAKALIGADGVDSLIARKSGLRDKWQRDHVMLGVVAEIPVSTEEFQDHSTIHIIYGIHGLGYGWLFPKQRYINIGIAGLLSVNQRIRMKIVYEQFLQTLKAQRILPYSVKTPHLKGGLIPINGVIPRTQTDRVLLCGDAAGFVHAVTGEGIYYAMISGELAAKAIIRGLKQRNLSEQMLTALYQRAWQAEIGHEIASSVHIRQRLLKNPGLTNILVRTVAKHEGMKKVFTDYFMGKISYPKLKYYLLIHFFPQYIRLHMLNIFRRVQLFHEKT